MSNKQEIEISPGERIIFLLGMIMLTALICFNPRAPFYDEVYYLKNVVLIHEYGLSEKYLQNLVGSAGPLYSVIHYLLEPLTHLKPPYIRFVNLTFLAGAILLMGRTLTVLKWKQASFALYVMAIPMTYVIGGLALTEMPAIFFLSAGIYFLQRGAALPGSGSTAILFMMVSGVCFGLAIIGRQPYLLVLAAIPVLLYEKDRLLLLAIILVFSLIMPAYVFYNWQGFVAPGDALFYKEIEARGTSLAPQYMVLCLSYFAILFALISPGIFVVKIAHRWFWLGTAILITGMVNYLTQWVIYLPLKPYTGKLFTNAQQVFAAEIFCGTMLMVLALYFLFSIIIRVLERGFDKTLAFYAAALILVAVSCVKITYGFSSRYAAQAIPMIIPLAGYFYEKNVKNQARAAIGVIIGLLSLGSFLFQEYL